MPQWRSKILDRLTTGRAAEGFMGDISSSDGSDVIQTSRCSKAPVYLTAAYLIVAFFNSMWDLSGVEKFIRVTGGQHCWAYSSFSIYAALDIGQFIVGATATFIMWRLCRSGRCRLSLMVFGLVVVAVLAEIFILRGDCIY
jgi:hypothetical protein